MQEQLEEEPAVTLTVNISRKVTVTDTSEAFTFVFKLKGYRHLSERAKKIDQMPLLCPGPINTKELLWRHFQLWQESMFWVGIENFLERFWKNNKTAKNMKD